MPALAQFPALHSIDADFRVSLDHNLGHVHEVWWIDGNDIVILKSDEQSMDDYSVFRITAKVAMNRLSNYLNRDGWDVNGYSPRFLTWLLINNSYQLTATDVIKGFLK